MSKDCPVCGKEIDDESRFCRECAGRLQSQSAANANLLNNRFEISSIISSSAERMLYRAIDIRQNTAVAIKMFLTSHLDPSDLQNIKERFAEKERFTSLAHLLTELNHHGLPRIVDFFTGNDISSGKEAHFLVMTFIEGKSLEIIMKERMDKPLPLDKAMEYFRQILEILKYLHSRTPSFTHGDIAPRNILIDEGMVYLTGCRIVDFSAPRQKDLLFPGITGSESTKSIDDPGNDIYSLGAIMCYLLTGKYAGEDMELSSAAKALRKVNAEVPEYLDRIVCSILNAKVESRLSSASQALDMLKEGMNEDAELMSLKIHQQILESRKEEKLSAGIDSQEKKKSDASSARSGSLSGLDHHKSKTADEKALANEVSRVKAARAHQEELLSELSAAVPAHPGKEQAMTSFPGSRFSSETEEKRYERIVINSVKVAEFNSWLGRHMEAKHLFPSVNGKIEGTDESADQHSLELEKLALMTRKEKEAKIELINSLLDTFESIKQKERE